MSSDWKTYVVFVSEDGQNCRLATREHFIGKTAALEYAQRELEYLKGSGGGFVVIPMSELLKATRPTATKPVQYWLDLEGGSFSD